MLFLALSALVVAGCATRVRLDVPRMPTIDTRGISRVAVMPFEPGGPGTDRRTLAENLTSQATSRLRAITNFELVAADRVELARRSGNDVGDYVDALFTGRLTNYSARTTSSQRQRTNSDGSTTTVTVFTREVEVAFEFSFVRPRDGTIIGTASRSGRRSESNEVRGNLTPEMTMAHRIIESRLSDMERDVTTHFVRVARVLERERDKALRPQMNAARDQVRNGFHRPALQAYMDIWNTHGSVAAAINASIMMEALGETENAIAFLQQVDAVMGSPIVASRIAVLSRELSAQIETEAFENARSPLETVSDNAISAVLEVLPGNANVIIHNDTSQGTHQNIVNDVIDNMISTFLGSGITVVEREMIDMIIAEQNMHLDGSISDDDFISIGNLSGANTIVVVGITGAGNNLRLQVRVLDIATGRVLMRSGTGSEWSL